MAAVQEIKVTLPHPALPGADWADCWQTDLPDQRFADARELGEAFIASFPAWVWPLLALRNTLVSPFGLTGTKEIPGTNKIGFFPVVTESNQKLVAGLDDKHLDFRIVLSLAAAGPGQRLSLTTVIKRHNWLGRFYLQIVLPFHRAIIRTSLREMSDR